MTDSNGNQTSAFSVELVGSDAMHDLAVLRIVSDESEEVIKLQPMPMGHSSDLKARAWMFASRDSIAEVAYMHA